VTKKFAQTVLFSLNIRSKLFGTPTAAEYTDLTDVMITFNNSSDFISVIKP